VGLLAGENDQEGARRSGEGRDINRHNYSLGEIRQAVKKDAVQRLVKLIRFRNEYPAFDGDFNVLPSEPHEINLAWKAGAKTCTLRIDLNNNRSMIEYIDDQGEPVEYVV
jgi:sucrose phosphorylase